MTKPSLRPCPATPNCVSSCAPASDRVHHIAPLKLDAEAHDPLARARAVIASWPRTELRPSAPGTLHAIQRSRLFGWKDDLELLVSEDEGVIHVRSASRVGRGDLGVNRRRVETLRAAL